MKNLKSGVRQVESNLLLWKSLKGKIDSERYRIVMLRLEKEKTDAIIFYNAARHFFVTKYKN